MLPHNATRRMPGARVLLELVEQHFHLVLNAVLVLVLVVVRVPAALYAGHGGLLVPTLAHCSPTDGTYPREPPGAAGGGVP